MKNKLYGTIWILLLLLSHRTDAMHPRDPGLPTHAKPFYMFGGNINDNYELYKATLGNRSYVKILADYTPLVGAALVPTGVTNKLVGTIPYLDESTKNKVTLSLNRALKLNLLPATYRIAKPVEKVEVKIPTDNQAKVFMEMGYEQSKAKVDECETRGVLQNQNPYDQSPIIPTLVFVGTYMAIDLTTQAISEMVTTEEVNKIPYAKETKQWWNEHVEPGSGTVLAQLGLLLAASYIRSMV
jgi:hypothetical protein